MVYQIDRGSTPLPTTTGHINIRRLIPLIVCVFACSAFASDGAIVDRAAADIGMQQEDGRSVREFMTPPGYQQGDGLITYEGPGWESDRVAFRLYLDRRNALDVFGKKTADLILSQTGRGVDYHEMTAWGMDILKVGESLGAGGVGVVEDGRVRQIGDARRYEAKIIDDTATSAGVRVTHFDSLRCGGDVVIEYTIQAGQRRTAVQILSDCNLPLAAGLTIHPGTERFGSAATDSEWQYIARYDEQSLAGDGLGLALFYRSSQVESLGQDDDDDYVIFKSGSLPAYQTAAAWAQEPGGLRNSRAFQDWLRDTQRSLNQELH